MSTQAKNQTSTKQATEVSKPVVDTNVYRLSLRTPFRQALFVAKIIIKKHGSVQIESLGAASSEASKVAQVLVKHGFATIKSINTDQFAPNGQKGRFQIKLVIVLNKTAEFDKLTETLVIKQ